MSYEETSIRIEKVTQLLENIAALIGQPNGKKMVDSREKQFTPGIGMIAESDLIRQRVVDLHKGTFRILVMGEFKNGKSTLLNSLLGDEILPAKVTPATAIITVIVSGAGGMVRVYESAEDETVMRELTVPDFKKEFIISIKDQDTLNNKGKLDRFANIQFAEVESTYKLVKDNKVSLIDSPGLAEHASRTKVTRNFVSRVQAIVLVLRADKILSEYERKFLEEIGTNRLEHVFALINRSDMVPADQMEELREFVREALSPFYCLTNSTEVDEDLYGRRVFFVSAKKALDARIGSVKDLKEAEQALAASNIPQFERELEVFLTSEERVRAALSTSMIVAAGTVQSAESQIETRLQGLSGNLTTLLKRQQENEVTLRNLELDVKEIEAQIRRHVGHTARKVQNSLIEFVNALPNTWEEDSETIINLNSAINVFKLTKGVFSEKAKQEINEAISKEIENYLDAKFTIWSGTASKTTDDGVKEMAEDIKYQLENFEGRLNEVVAHFVGGKAMGDFIQMEQGQTKAMKLSLLVAYALFVPGGWHDAGMMTSMLWSKFDLRRVVQRIGEQIAVIVGAIIVAYFFGGPVAWAALLAAQIARGKGAFDEAKIKVRAQIGEEMFRKLKEEALNSATSIEDEVKKVFDKASAEIVGSLRNDLDSVRKNQDEIIKQIQGTQAEIDLERERLRQVQEMLRKNIEEMAQLIYQRSIKLSDLQAQS